MNNPMNAYYKSKAFDNVLSYIGRHLRRCNLKEIKGRRMIHISEVESANEGLNILREINGMT